MNGTDPAHAVEPGEYLSRVIVDLGAIQRNYVTLRRLLPESTELFAVVKADAYGRGAVPVSKGLVKAGARLFCVARVEEAAELRNAGIKQPVLVLAPPFREQAAAAVRIGASMVVCSPEHIEAAESAARNANANLAVHLKVDTGMGRLGVRPEDALEFARKIAASKHLLLEGVMAHLPYADAVPGAETRRQVEQLVQVQKQVKQSGLHTRYIHTANTAAIMQYPAPTMTAARAGIGLYGQYPSADMARSIPLEPAMTLLTRITFLKTVPTGTGLSYGHTFVTTRPSTIATIGLGYADGYPRHASNRGTMLVRGKMVPVAGRVCMDHILLDVTDVPDVAVGDEVLVFGARDGHEMRAEEVATQFDSIGYELTTRIGKRLSRTYLH